MWAFSSSVEYIQKKAQVKSDSVTNLPKWAHQAHIKKQSVPVPQNSPIPSASDDFPKGNQG